MNFSLQSVTNCLGYAQDTDLSAVSNLPSIPTVNKQGLICKPRLALIQCTGKDVRWRDDGTNPSSTVGMTLVVGDTLAYDGDITNIKFIETSASAILNVSYYA